MSANRQNGQATELSLFETNDLRTFDDAFPDFQTPEEIGSFSLDINREFENSKKYMKYFVKPPDPSRVNFDLRKGYDTMIKNKKKNEFHILRWIVENLEKFPLKRREDTKGQNGGASGQDRPMKDHGKSISAFSQQHSDEQNQSDQEVNGVQMKLSKMKVSNEDGSETSVPCDITPDRKTRNLDTDFVCRRGLLAKIMRTPYEKKEDWLIAVTLYNGTYYMDDIETEQRKKDEAKWNGREMCCWGWKFEQYLTAGLILDVRRMFHRHEISIVGVGSFYAVTKFYMYK